MSTRLIIAEKPNVAKAIAEALSGGSPRQNSQGIYEVAGDRIAACSGHILEQYNPGDYDESLKKWSIESLPIIPDPWKLKPIPANRKRLEQIKNGMQGADIVINCGDNDAEGNLLVDEVIDYLGWKGTVQRLLISDLNPGPIKKAMTDMKDNKEFAHLTRKALARSQADWLLGMNCTRLYSKLADKAGIKGVLSAGRVQSAVLGLISRRDLEIKNFKPHDYHIVKLEIAHSNGNFMAKWKPSETQEGLDSEGRLTDIAVVDQLKGLAPGAVSILSADTQRKKQQAPLPFSLSELQKAGNSRLGLTMAGILSIAQELYDQFKLTTYPRTDTGYLPEAQHSSAPETLSALAQNLPGLAKSIDGADTGINGRAFNDKKVQAHHGIVPTAKADPAAIEKLSRDAKAVYEMICERFIAQFYPDAEFDATRISVGAPDSAGEQFVATGKVWKKQGWRSVLKPVADDAEQDDDGQSLPEVAAGDDAQAATVTADKKKTKPPKPFTDATLLDAMTSIHRYVANAAIKKMLREGDGIGTEATRANIVETLIARKLLKREKKNIHATQTGLAHFTLMPADLTTPDMAGIFERDTRRIEAGEMSPDDLLERMVKFIRLQIDNQEAWLEKARKHAPVEKPSEYECRNCSKPLFEKVTVKNKKRLTYFACKADGCECCFRSDNGAPTLCFRGPLKDQDAKEATEKREALLRDAPVCSVCGNPLLRRTKAVKGGDWHFWTCETYHEKKGCESIFLDSSGEPGRLYVKQGKKVERQADGPACPECEAETFTGVTKAEQTPILICKACDSMFGREDGGSPGLPKRVRGEWAKRPGDGPPCPECKAATRRAKTKKTRKPILICGECDSMFWTKQSGDPLKAFKVKGELIKD